MKNTFLIGVMCLIMMPIHMTAQNTITLGSTVEPSVILGYLKVFPYDLGTFDAEPKTVIEKLNEKMQFGYGTWRLPTEEELALMRGQNVIENKNYMSQKNQSGIVRLVTDREKGETEYVDLGLPSKTLWKYKNEGDKENERMNWSEANRRFGNSIPTDKQWKELHDLCEWAWTGNGYKVTGPNGNHIVLPANGVWWEDINEIRDVGEEGYYWANNPKNGQRYDCNACKYGWRCRGYIYIFNH